MNTQGLSAQIDELFAPYRREDSPGCAVAVMKDGAIIYKQGYGLANLEHGVPIRPSTKFNIGSESKQFTAMAILLLAKAGKLSLDDDIRQHLPEAPDFGKVITIRHLIHHTSGVRCSFPPLLMLGGWYMADLTTNEDVYRLFLAQRELNFDPGEEFSYANMGYIILARIVERASGQPFAAFCQAEIFEPLGMTGTLIHDNPFLVVADRAQSYWLDDKGRLFRNLLADGVCGPTNVYTTVEDLALWDENFYSGQVGGLELIAQMQEVGRLNDGTELDYAGGLMLGPMHVHKGYKLVEHGGEHGGYVTTLLRFPEVHLSVAIIFNFFTWPIRQHALQIADILLPEMPEPDAAAAVDAQPRIEILPVAIEETSLAAKAGMYFNARRAVLREFKMLDGQLSWSGMMFLPLDENRFVLKEEPDIEVIFTPGPNGRPDQVQILSPSTAYIYHRVEATSPLPEDLQEYEGQYYSPELNIFWTVILSGEQLIVKHQRYKETHLLPVFTDGFKDDWSEVVGFPLSYFWVFERGPGGAISGFRVSDDRMRNLRFWRQKL